MADQVQRTQLSDGPTHQQMERVRRQGNETSQVSIVQGKVVEVDLENAADTTVKHGLGRRPEGFILIGLRGATSAGYILTQGRTSTALTLQANGYGATVEARLWVF